LGSSYSTIKPLAHNQKQLSQAFYTFIVYSRVRGKMAFILGYFLIGAVVVTLIFLLVLRLMEKKLKEKILGSKNSRNRFYLDKANAIDPKNENAAINRIDKVAKSFFMEAFKVKGSSEYSELVTIFTKKNNKKAKLFCEIMTRELYSKEKPDPQTIQDLINLLVQLISSNRIITKAEQIELDKRSKQGFKAEKTKVKQQKATAPSQPAQAQPKTEQPAEENTQ
jgi:hypothetical protein